MLQLSSLQNNRIKTLVKLSKRRERDARRVTLVEGAREIFHLLEAGLLPEEVYVCPALLDSETQPLLSRLQQSHEHLSAKMSAVSPLLTTAALAVAPPEFIEVTPPVFEKIAYRASGGLLLVLPYVNQPLTSLPLSHTPLVVVIEGVEKPGNLGAILRTADAVGVDAVIVCAGATDLHNPNVVRASLGALFTLPIAEVGVDELRAWLTAHQIHIVAADPAATIYYAAHDFSVPTAVVMGSEAHGLSQSWLTGADAIVKIPMHGVVDSLNLSAATAVILYEALRQRMATDTC